jgi:hypothetical protein
LGTYATFGHESVNMGYTGLIVEYRYQPHRLLHFGGSMLVGYGGATTMRSTSSRPSAITNSTKALRSA